MLKAFTHLTKILTVFFLGIVLVQGVFGFSDIKVKAGDSSTNATDNISSLNNCSVYLSGVTSALKVVPITGPLATLFGNETIARAGDIGPCVDDAGKLYYDCTDSDVTHLGFSNITKASCRRASQAPTSCYDFPNRTLGTGNRDITLKKTAECETALKETCSNQWDSGSNKMRDGCKLLYNNVKPIVAITNSGGVTELTKCNTNFTPQDDTDLAKRNTKKGADGKYPQGTCKDDSGKLFICNQTPDSTGKYTNCVAANEEAKDGNKVVTPKSDDKSLGNGLIGIFLALLSIILLVIFYILNWALSFVLWVLGLIFVNILVINPVSVEYIEVAKAPWQILVNMANLLTLASLIFVGIGYILNIKSLKIGIQQLLLNVTIFSLLLNFTLLGLQGLTTITQGVGDAMITARSGQPPAFLSGGQNKLLDSVLIGIQGISLVRCGNANLDGLAIKCQTGTTEAEKANATDTNFGGDFGNLTKAIDGDALDITAGKIGDKTLRAMLLEVVYTMVLLYTITVMFKGAMMVLVRLVAFWLLLIVSPLALASYFMPVPSIKKYAGQWAEKTWQLAIFYPVAILLLILISEIVSQFAGAINKSIGGAATTATGNAAYLDTVRVYALTGDFGSVFTALLGSILIGVVAAAAFGAMSTFMDKFLGPIAKALGDGIKSAASALGTAGYIGGGAIRMGAGLANKATGGALGAITSRFGGAKTAEKMKSMQDRLAKDRKTLQNRKDRNVMRAERGQSLMDNSALEKKIKSQQRDYIGLKGAVKRRAKFNKGVDRIKKSKLANAGLKFDGFGKSGFGKFNLSANSIAGAVPSLGNSLLNTMQFGVNDVSNLVATGGLLWKSMGTKRKAQEAERKKMAEGRLEAFLARRQQNNPLFQDLLAYSPELNMLNGKYTPGEEFKLSDEEIKKLISDESRRHGDKIGGINRDTTLGQAKKLIEKYQEIGYKNLNNIQRNNLRDIYEKAQGDKGFAESLSLDTVNQSFLAENAYSMLGTAGAKSFAKAAPQLMVNSQGGTGNLNIKNDDGIKRNNSEIEDELKSFARSYAQASPDSELRRSTNASSLIANPVIMETIDAINPELGAQMRKNSKLDGDFNSSYSQVEAYKEAAKYKDSNPAVYQGIVAAASSRASNGYASTPQLRVRLAQAGEDTAAQNAAYSQFYNDEYGTEAVSKDSINGLSLEQLKNSNLGRAAIAKLPNFSQLTDSKQKEYLLANAQATWRAFERTENSFRQRNTLQVKTSAEHIENSQNRVDLAESSRRVQANVANIAGNGGVSQIRQLRENGRAISDINRYNSSAEGGQEIDLRGQLEQAIQEEGDFRLAPLLLAQTRLNELNNSLIQQELDSQNQINALTLQISQDETVVINENALLAQQNALLVQQNQSRVQDIQSRTAQLETLNSELEVRRSGNTNFGLDIDAGTHPTLTQINRLNSEILQLQNESLSNQTQSNIAQSESNIAQAQLRLTNNQQERFVSQQANTTAAASLAENQVNINSNNREIATNRTTRDVATLGEENILKRVQDNSTSYLQGVASTSGGRLSDADARNLANNINASGTTYSDIKLIADNQDKGDYAQRLQIEAGGETVSYEAMLSVPEVNTIAGKTFKTLRENGKIGNLDVSTDGNITSDVIGSFEQGASKILTDLSQSIEKGEDYDINKFKAALANSNNVSWANTSLGQQLGSMMGFENQTNSSGVVELIQNPDSTGVFTRNALLRSGEKTSADQMSAAARGNRATENEVFNMTNNQARDARAAVIAQQTASLTRETEDVIANLVRVQVNRARTP